MGAPDDRHDGERAEVAALLQAIAGLCFAGAFMLIVVVALVMPFLTDREPADTLLLGLAAIAATAAGAFFGIRIVLWNR